MKTTNIVILSIIVCIVGAAFFFACKHTYDSKVTTLKNKAKEAFVEALNQELRKRNLEGHFSFQFNAETAAKVLPDSVYMDDEFGRHWFRLESKKDSMNITQNNNMRILHSITFRKSPINPDSLNAIWKESLLKSDISAQSILSISVMDRKEDVKVQNLDMNEWCNQSNLIFTVYIGYACEIEVMGYLQYSLWYLMGIEIVFYLLMSIVCIYGIYKSCMAIQSKLAKMKQKEFIEVPVIKLMKEVDGTPIRTYKLRENIILYADLNKIEIDGEERKLQPQSSQLLELFLEEKDNGYILTYDVISKFLWSDGTGSQERIHQAIKRLRFSLRQTDPSIDIIRGTKTYKLVL